MSTRIYIPDNKKLETALKRVKHWAIVAHQDDAEIISGHLLYKKRKDFGVIVLTNGAGSLRSKKTKRLSESKIIEIRNKEQEKAALLGGYSIVIQMNLPSGIVKGKRSRRVALGELKSYLLGSKAESIVTHSPFDRHETHRSVVGVLIDLFSSIEMRRYPRSILGVEVWGNLDWLPEDEKIYLPIKNPKFVCKLLSSYRSQNETGKLFHLGTVARMAANATFSESIEGSEGGHFLLAHDLVPFISGNVGQEIIKQFQLDMVNRLKTV